MSHKYDPDIYEVVIFDELGRKVASHLTKHMADALDVGTNVAPPDGSYVIRRTLINSKREHKRWHPTAARVATLAQIPELTESSAHDSDEQLTNP